MANRYLSFNNPDRRIIYENNYRNHDPNSDSDI